MRSKLPSYLRDLSVQERDALLAAVLDYASDTTNTAAEARLLTMETFEAVATSRAYDPNGKTTLLQFMLGTARSLRGTANRAATRRRKHEKEASREAVALSGRTAASPEELILEASAAREREARSARIVDKLRAKLAGWPLELRLLELKLDESAPRRAREQAPLLGVPVEDVYRAAERIQRYLESIVAEEEEAAQ
jgi:hypothetical protein